MIVVSVYDLNTGKELERKEFNEYGVEPVNYYYKALYPFESQKILAGVLMYDENQIILGFNDWH